MTHESVSLLTFVLICVSIQTKLQECQKTMAELEAELQRANNKVCHTGHLLNQMTIKVKRRRSFTAREGLTMSSC